jgi:hypothetical protein
LREYFRGGDSTSMSVSNKPPIVYCSEQALPPLPTYTTPPLTTIYSGP